MSLCLSITRNGVKEPYSEQQLRKDYPNVSFARGLAGVDLAPYGVEIEPNVVVEAPVVEPMVVEKLVTEVKKVAHSVPPDPKMVPMHCFLYGLREFGLRVQAERYFLVQQGHARDYWYSCPYVADSSTYVRHLADFFALSTADLDTIFTTAAGIEE